MVFPATKNATRTTLALIIVGVYVLMWAWIIHDIVIEPSCVGDCDETKNLEKLGDFVGIISTMTVLVTLVVQFYFRRSNPSDREDPMVTLKKKLASQEITKEQFEEMKKLITEK